VISGPVIQSKDLWLRSDWDFAGDSQFSFSTDGTTFTPLGAPYRLTWGNYRATELAFTTTTTGRRQAMSM